MFIAEFLYTSMNLEIYVINKFVLYNVKTTRPWVVLYEEKRRKCDSDRKTFRLLNGRSMPYPDHLKEKYVENMSQRLGG
jgi:hypothetical protein